VFKSDADLKEKTLEKAKTEGVTLKAVLTMAMRAYINDEMVLGMWKREEIYDDYDDSPPEKNKKTEKKKKIPGGIKSPISNFRVVKKKEKKIKLKTKKHLINNKNTNI
jgi:hypothetical protein